MIFAIRVHSQKKKTKQKKTQKPFLFLYGRTCVHQANLSATPTQGI